jgi:hypothetical protein
MNAGLKACSSTEETKAFVKDGLTIGAKEEIDYSVRLAEPSVLRNSSEELNESQR